MCALTNEWVLSSKREKSRWPASSSDEPVEFFDGLSEPQPPANGRSRQPITIRIRPTAFSFPSARPADIRATTTVRWVIVRKKLAECVEPSRSYLDVGTSL